MSESTETRHFIAGSLTASGEQSFRAHNAATGEEAAPSFTEATPEEVQLACRLADEALDAYRQGGLSARADFLDHIAEELEALEEAFVETATTETGLPEGRIRGELARTSGQMRMFARVVRAGDFLGVRIDHGDGTRPDLRQYKTAIGPVAVFGASNFPLAFSVAGGDTASALAAGCPVVVKAHPAHPSTSALAARAISRAVERSSVPAGVFSMLHGRGNDVGQTLVSDPRIAAVGFTGSRGGGLALARIASERAVPIPVFAEMSSVNPIFALPDGLSPAGEVAHGYLGSLSLGCGQFCTNPGLLFAVRGKELDDFVNEVGAKIPAIAPGVMLHGGILEAFENRLQVMESVSGVEVVGKGTSAQRRARASVMKTDLDTFRANPELREEAFGPAGLIIEVPDEDALYEAAEMLSGQLTVTVHGSVGTFTRFQPLVTTLEKRAGRLLFNGYSTGVEVTHAMMHGGPYPATTDPRFTSVGTGAIDRFLRPVCYQDYPEALLPQAIHDSNPLNIRRLVNSTWE